MDLTAMFKDYAVTTSCRIFENKLMKREGTWSFLMFF